MRKPCLLVPAFLFLISAQVLHAEKTKDLAVQAIRTGNYDQAVTLCLKHLSSNPNDSDVSFILAQAYAYSGRRQDALGVLEEIMTSHPENLDALLLWSRVRSWEKEYGEAENGYRQVLLFDPDNTEAKIGMAETASWQGDYSRAEDIYKGLLQKNPENPELFYRLGRVYEWGGNYEKAKENFRMAVLMDPENKEYRRALAASRPQIRSEFEFRYQQRIESFSDHRKNYWDQSLVFLFASPGKTGPLLVKANQTRRMDEQDYQFGMEFYPHLWKGAYGFFDLSYSPEAVLYPQISLTAEVYQAFLSSAEFSLGYRRLIFEQNPVSISLGSLGYYLGSFYTYLRWYYSFGNREDSLSWTLNARRYFSRDNFVFVSYGQGSRPFDVATIDDLFIVKSRIIQAGATWYVLRKIRLEFHMAFTDEKNGPNRSAFHMSTGYRW